VLPIVVLSVLSTSVWGDEGAEVVPQLQQVQNAIGSATSPAAVNCDPTTTPLKQDDVAPDPSTIVRQTDGKIFYHNAKVDGNGNLVPWCDGDRAHCFDHVMDLTWKFWKNMNQVETTTRDGKPVQLPYYMLHQVWKPEGDTRGVGGDQFQMAMSSWGQYYQYTGDEDLKKNMKFMADYYLANSLSPSNAKWAGLPFPYNCNFTAADATNAPDQDQCKPKSGSYDGDMIDGNGVLQPDKAGSFGLELTKLYKMTSKDPGSKKYLNSAIKIAQSLMSHIQKGDADSSPLPFKVNAFTGEVAPLIRDRKFDRTKLGDASYTTNWFSTMQLFLDLQKLDPKNAPAYKKAFNTFVDWMKNYPLKTNKWGPFFEDVSSFSDTQINATTAARFILEHQEYFPDWKTQVPGIFKWTYATLGDDTYKKYGVVMPDEQTSYRVPGESHTARQGSTELLWANKSGDTSGKENALRQLDWSTYTVDNDGKNVFPSNEIWLTDGYGDYVRHYLWAMNERPDLAPSDSNHILSSTSVLGQVAYAPGAGGVSYRTFDKNGTESIRMTKKPASVRLNGHALKEGSGVSHYSWQPLAEGGGVLKVTRLGGDDVSISQ
jgi:hypothetical protein